MPWKVVLVPEVQAWRNGLSMRDRKRLDKSLEGLEEHGPQLGRPRADSIKASRHHNMKELRSLGGHIRVLFAFDRRRNAIMLVGGDKRDNWTGWYKENIPIADARLDRHERDFGEGTGWVRTGPRSSGPRPGDRSGGMAL